MRSSTSEKFDIKENEYQPVNGTITRTHNFTEDDKLFEIQLLEGKDLGHQPGQFVMLLVPNVGEVPISVTSSPTKPGPFELTIRAVGNVTNAIHKMGPGDSVGIRGPYGTGFKPEIFEGEDMLYIAGGIGLAPLRSMINYSLDNREKFGDLTTVYGAKEPAEQLYTDELQDWKERDDMEYLETVDQCPTDQEWEGRIGVITTCIPDVNIDPDTTKVLVCGPPVMYQFVLEELDDLAVPDENIYLSLERNMHCGRGLCGHCQMNELYVCTDGPVFNYPEVRDKEEAEV
ncbi:anaerobic sulfite reductase subunit B [Halalkaliarchaeum desulfuricum]|uniref:Anaerobic sulfite reductase subunit B n=1 Tax=Halalkaliarchaeum desulfuricum TaxID=2055893 RepID=A0A343TLR9_9EURY|nr:FAD/NAD(P)-binding protein [Halalkaliarchaeum desulfuricum]AUX10041.1 anaerobic sulfite reductase subunit B [Halalkaliarchaeum desulfuricum]